MSLAAFQGQADPAALFLALWAEAIAWSPVMREDAIRRPDVVRTLVDELLMEEDGAIAADHLVNDLTATEDGTVDRDRGAVLDAMAIIDEVFEHIHPKMPVLAPAKSARRKLPAWLSDLQEHRTLGRPYAQDDMRLLVARGPFTAKARTAAQLYGETLEDRFRALTGAPRFTEVHGRRIRIDMRTVGHDVHRGVPLPAPADRNPGRESVGVVAIAERASELKTERHERESGPCLDIRAHDTVPAGDRFFDGVSVLGHLDIALAPELTMSEKESGLYAARLSASALSTPRLSVAGSGGSLEADDKGRRANVSIMYNAFGAELWRHRKVWPYKMSATQVDGFNWPPIKASEMLTEDLVDGDSLTVADIDGLGRVVTLICQDFEMDPGVGEAIRTYQPDWVLVPILDAGTDLVRWPHQRAFELSGRSNARFIAVSSLALSEQAGTANYESGPIAVLVGPKNPTEGSISSSRAVAALVSQHASPMCGRITWGDDNPAWTNTSFARARGDG